MKELFLRRLSEGRDSFERFNEIAKQDGVYLFGAGFIGTWSVGYLRDVGIRVNGFIDSDPKKWGSLVSGVQVYPLEEARVLDPKCILITSRHHVRAVQESLSPITGAKLSVDAFVVHTEGIEKIATVGNFFESDLKSIDTYYAILIAMLEGESRHLSRYADNRPFFDRFGFFNRDGEIFVDAGAYVGDSLERFIWSVNGAFKHIHAFEPGEKQFDALKSRVQRLSREWALASESISLVNKGISSSTGKVNLLCQENPIQTRVDLDRKLIDNGGVEAVADTISLDDYFGSDQFSFLKVDIEGSELALLEGATRCIQAHRPRIALSVYHFPSDIFSLLLKCKEINHDYVFSLGHHSSQLMDTVLYCRDINE